MSADVLGAIRLVLALRLTAPAEALLDTIGRLVEIGDAKARLR